MQPQPPITIPGATACACFLLGLWSGCGSPGSTSNLLTAQARQVEQLPGLRSTSHPALQQAWRELESQQQLPQQLVCNQRADAYDVFSFSYPELTHTAIAREIQSIWPATGFTFSPGALQKARNLVATHAAARQRFARVIEGISPQSYLSPRDRLQTSEAWLDAATVGCRIEGLAAAEALAEGSPDDAIPPLARMLLVSQQLAREAQLNVRLTAVAIRQDALQVLFAIANHPSATQPTLGQLQQTLLAHTGDWPTDEAVWIAERAHGLLVYELVRDGHYLSQLPREQLAELKRLGLVNATREVALRNVDDDELFYLRAMKLQIAAAKLPYFQRVTATVQLQAELQTRQETGDYPLVAGTLLLPDAADIHRRLTEDRCRCEAWLIALAAALDQPLGPLPVCPLTGQAYELHADRQQVTIVNVPLSAGETIRVTRTGVVQAQRRAAGFDLR